MAPVDVGADVHVNEVLLSFASIDDQQINGASRLVEDLGLDSVDVVEVIIELNTALGIELPDAEVSEWKTVGDVYTSVLGVRKLYVACM